MSEVRDAIVIGAGPEGLIAATYLAAAGVKTLVLGAGAATPPLGDPTLPTGASVLEALDPRVIKELKLTRLGLKFAARDLTLTGLGTKPLPLGRDVRAAARALAAVSAQDGRHYAAFRRGLYALARALRAIWWDEGTLAEKSQIEALRRLAATSAEAFLDAAFESEPAKAALAFDALSSGASPANAGTALIFAWRAAQEMCGLQGAVAVPKGGFAALLRILSEAAAGAEIKAEAVVSRLLLADGAVWGVKLATGEEIAARAVLSTLSRRRTLLTLAPAGATGLAASLDLTRHAPAVGEGRLVYALDGLPGFAAAAPTARFVMVERLEACIAAHAAARAGRLPDELALEFVVPTAFDSTLAPQGRHILSARIRPLPVAPQQGWQALAGALMEKTLALFERAAPGFGRNVVTHAFVPPRADGDAPDLRRALVSWRERITTPIAGLYLCGEAAEPIPALSGRAARLAAGIALAQLKGASA